MAATEALPASANVDDTVKYKFAPFGEIGGGYSFGGFRFEETLGYSSSDAKGTDTQGRSWGPFWHLDAGVAFRVAPRVTLEVGGRYSRSLSMKRFGHSDSDSLLFTSQFNSMTATAGVRYAF